MRAQWANKLKLLVRGKNRRRSLSAPANDSKCRLSLAPRVSHQPIINSVLRWKRRRSERIFRPHYPPYSQCNFWLVLFQGDRYAARKTPRRIQRVKRVICNANWYCYLFCCRLLFVCLFLLTVSLRDPRRALFYSLLISCSKAHTMKTHNAPQISQWRRFLRWMNEQHQVTQQETNLKHREILNLCAKAPWNFFYQREDI
jgi:hypothetical protein